MLLVDPDEEWLVSAKGFFEEIHYQVDMVANGKDAQLQLYNEKYFAIVLNVDVKNHSGIQVLRFIKTNHPSQKVILVLNKDKSHYDMEKLTKIGATETIEKPFEMGALKGLLEGHQSIGDMVSTIPKRTELGPEEEVDAEDEKFTKVKINEFYSSQPVLFDIFVKLKSNRYVKILHAGDALSKERLNKYENEKGVEHLYFDKKDNFKFVKFNNYFAKKVIANPNVPGANKIKIMQNVSEKYLEQAFTEGLKPQIIDQGKEICANIFDMVQNDDDLYKVLRAYDDFDPNAFTHAYLVTLFSSAIIKGFEWQSRTTIECVPMACMFHDIGKMKLPKEMLGMKVDDMSDEQYEQFKMHPEYGLEIVDGKRLINNSVKQIILQHHEHFDGTGFPFAKRGVKILTLANIVCLADSFVHIIQEEDMKPVVALKELLSRRDHMGRYNSMIVENLIKSFADPGKILKESQNIPGGAQLFSKKAS
jgi:putative nucleotidyltransferase with HDIG domain